MGWRPSRLDPRRRFALGLLALLAALTIVFAVTATRSSGEFSDYRRATVEEVAPPWEEREASVDECIGFAIDWALACPGLQSWCEAEVPALVRDCLRSSDRAEYCAGVGDAILTTGFGFEDCAQRRETVSERHAARAHKKYCAKSYRVVADHCRDLGPR